jgi:hypothetical protein
MNEPYTCLHAPALILIGPYANAVLRFQIDFPPHYPQRPPLVVFQTDLFHPLVTPLTTYTHSTRDLGSDTQSAVDEQRLPPGGLSLRHGFPDWFDVTAVAASSSATPPAVDTASSPRDDDDDDDDDDNTKLKDASPPDRPNHPRTPHIVELLQYMRIIFDTDDALDAIPADLAANIGAWHAWQSFRSNPSRRPSPSAAARQPDETNPPSGERSMSPRQMPGGAKRPGEWNWQGVWEDRVRRSVQNSLSDPVLFGSDSNDIVSHPSLPVFPSSSRVDVLLQITFLKMDPEASDLINPGLEIVQPSSAA